MFHPSSARRPPRCPRRSRWSRAAAAVAVAVAVIAATPAASADEARGDACASPPEVAAEIAAIGEARSGCESNAPCWGVLVDRAAALAAAHPRDVMAQRTWQILVQARQGDGADEARRELFRHFNARRLASPDVDSLYLAARLVGGRQREALEIALAADPDAPWPHLGMTAALLGEDAAAHGEAAQRHLATFLDACPSRFADVLQFGIRLDADFWRPRLPALRGRVEAASESEQVNVLRRLWEVDFRATPLAEHDEVRARVRRDLARVESWDRHDDLSWWYLRLAALERLGEAERRLAITAEAGARFPCSDLGEEAFQQRTVELVGEPGKSPELNDEQLLDLERVVRPALERCPKSFNYSSALYHAVISRHDVPAAERLAAAERHLEVWEANRDRYRMFHSPYYRVAEDLLRHGLAPGRAVELARKEIELVAGRDDERDDGERGDDAAPSDREAQRRRSGAIRGAGNHALLAEALLAQGEPGAAAESLATAAAFLAPHAAEEPDPAEAAVFAERRRRLTRLEGRIAEALERPLDALAFHLAAAVGDDDTADASRSDAQRLWGELGGSGGALDRLVAAVAGVAPAPADVAWAPRDEPVTDFTLSDLAGRTWRLADFAGKTVLVNVWATWCGPCRLELPYVETLHRRLADREDLAVMTLNTDFEVGLIAPYLEEEGFTFPTLLALAYIEQNQGGIAIPQTWIVDAEGRLRRLQSGFAPDTAADWVDDALAQLEAVAGGDAAATGAGESGAAGAAEPQRPAGSSR